MYIDQRLSELKITFFHQCVARVAYATHTDTRSHTGTENRGTVCQREKVCGVDGKEYFAHVEVG